MRGFLGRDRPGGAGASAERAPVRAPAPLVVLAVGASPVAVTAPPPGARLVDLRPGEPGHVPLAELGAFARTLPAGAAVVVRAEDPERAAAAAERLHALGLAASWLAPGSA